MSDLIERKMAIDAVAKWFHDVFGIKESDGTATIFKRLRELPSAQPTQTNADSTQCNTLDCVSRQAAIDAFDDAGFCTHGYIVDVLEELPSAQPRKTGKWIDLKCNQCGQVDMSKPNFCPNCGADMRGENNE